MANVLGNNTTPDSGYWYDVTQHKEFWTARQFTMPSGGGTATDIYVYAAGDGGSTTGTLVCWNHTNTIMFAQTVTLPAGNRAIRGQSWVHASVPSVSLPADTYWIGFWAQGSVVWTFQSSGGVDYRKDLPNGPGGNFGTNDEYNGAGYGELGAYVLYNPPSPASQIRLRRSGAWTTPTIMIRRAGAWTTPKVYIRRSGAWVQMQ